MKKKKTSIQAIVDSLQWSLSRISAKPALTVAVLVPGYLNGIYYCTSNLEWQSQLLCKWQCHLGGDRARTTHGRLLAGTIVHCTLYSCTVVH